MGDRDSLGAGANFVLFGSSQQGMKKASFPYAVFLGIVLCLTGVVANEKIVGDQDPPQYPTVDVHIPEGSSVSSSAALDDVRLMDQNLKELTSQIRAQRDHHL